MHLVIFLYTTLFRGIFNFCVAMIYWIKKSIIHIILSQALDFYKDDAK